MIDRRRFLAGTAAIVGTAILPWRSVRAAPPSPPFTPRIPKRIEQFGRVRIDPYAWLKPDNWKEVWRDSALLDARIRQHLEDENRYSAAVLAPLAKLQASLLQQMTAHLPAMSDTPPVVDGRWAYSVRQALGRQPVFLRRPRAGGPDEVILDGATRAAGKSFLTIRNATHSPDHRYFAWAEDRTGAEKFDILIKDLSTGEILAGGLGDAFGDFAFSADSRFLFWTWRDANSRPARLYRRPLRGGADTLVYEEPDPGFAMVVTRSASGDYLFLRSRNDVTSEVRIIDARRPEVAPVLVAPRAGGTDYDVEHWRDRFVMRTNANGARNYKLRWAPTSAPQGRWTDWIANRPGRTIAELHPRAGVFAWLERRDGNLRIMAADSAGAPRETVQFDEAAYALTVHASDYADDALVCTVESPRMPVQWIRCDLVDGTRRTLADEAPSGQQVGDYVLKRLHAPAPDGAMVPVTVLHAKGVRLDGKAPLLLTGYGSYGYSYETVYSPAVLGLVDRGWIWAVAHVRGGSEKGREWFEQARQLRKKTSFTDFIACAEMLVATRHTAPKRIAIHGFSAGGLLVGAAANMRPDLWSAVIGQAPFVDMLNTMSDTTHPLVPLTWPVWGDPLKSAAVYDYIASYSPYENVRVAPYPAVLATTAVADDRVGFWEPAKWVAALRDKSTSGKPMLLHTEMIGGHQGASDRIDELRQMARMYAFAIWQTNAK